MDPVTAGLVLGFGGSLLGGLFGSSSQGSANRANIKLARETNELNERLFNQNLDFQREMWQKTNDYNSPANQVGLLRQAGLNPADLMANKNQGLASAPSSVGVPQMQTASVIPEDAMSRSLQSLGVDMANTYLQISQANKARAEKTGIDTDNKYKAALHALDLATKGAQKEAQDLMNDFSRQTLDNRVEETRLNNVLISEKTNNLVADTAVKKVTEHLESEKIKLTQKQVEELDALIKKHIAESDYYISQKELNGVLKNESASRTAFNYVNAEMSKVVGYAQAGAYKAQAGMYGSQAGLFDEQAFGAQLQNDITKRYGNYETYHRILNIMNNTNLIDMNRDWLWKQIQEKTKDINWYEYNRILDLIKTASNGAGAGMLWKFILGI